MAIRLYNKYHAEDVTDYPPIAKALCILDKTTKQALQKKFEIAYFISKEIWLSQKCPHYANYKQNIVCS